MGYLEKRGRKISGVHCMKSASVRFVHSIYVIENKLSKSSSLSYILLMFLSNADVQKL